MVALVYCLEKSMNSSVICLIKSVDDEAYLSAPSNKQLQISPVCGAKLTYYPRTGKPITMRNYNLGCPHLNIAGAPEFL